MQPSSKSIGRALSQATERFACELAQPQWPAPDWSPFEWQMARAAAVLHGVTPLLAGALRWSGPAAWESFVAQQREQTLRRHRHIETVLEDIGARAATAGVALVALKGSALHALGLYSPGERPMADIDLLVRPGEASRAASVLTEAGYVAAGASWKDQTFVPAVSLGHEVLSLLPLGEHAARPVKIELHTRIGERLPVTEADITSLVFPEPARPGLNAYASNEVLLLHLLLHAAGNMSQRSIRLMHLHDIARFAATMRVKQWEELLDLSPAPHSFWWAFPPLELLNRYRPGLIPGQVLDRLRQGCRWPLRRLCHHATLSQLSFTSLALQAFPAKSWCGSWRELLRYVRHRILPSRELLAARVACADEQWSRQDAWSRMPQGRRMIRWLCARPPRRVTMYIVQAALQHPRA